jgi:hypothetical protein
VGIAEANIVREERCKTLAIKFLSTALLHPERQRYFCGLPQLYENVPRFANRVLFTRFVNPSWVSFLGIVVKLTARPFPLLVGNDMIGGQGFPKRSAIVACIS